MIDLIVTQRYIGIEGHMRPGDRVRVAEARARELISGNRARLVANLASPAANKLAAGPSETKAEDPAAGKSSGEPSITRSTASPSSALSGAGALAPSSRVGRRSARPRSPSSTPRTGAGSRNA